MWNAQCPAPVLEPPLLFVLFLFWDHVGSLPPAPAFPRPLPGGLPSVTPCLPAWPPGLCAPSRGAAECRSGGSCPPRCSPRGGPTVARVSPRAFEAAGRGGAAVWEESEGQWTVEGWLYRRTAGGQQGCGVEVGVGGWRGSHDIPKASKKPRRAGSHRGLPQGPRMLRCPVGSGGGVVAMLPGLKLSRALPEVGREPLLHSRERSSAPRSQGGQSSQQLCSALLWEPGWRAPRALIASIRSSILRG